MVFTAVIQVINSHVGQSYPGGPAIMSSGDNSTSRSSTAMSDREEIDLISDPEDEVEEAKQQLVPHEYSYSADITKNVHTSSRH